MQHSADCERITAAASMELRLACLLYAVGLCRAHALGAKRDGNVTLAFDGLLAKDRDLSAEMGAAKRCRTFDGRKGQQGRTGGYHRELRAVARGELT